MDLIASIRHNLAGLGRFSGRDRPGQFWPYAILLFLLSIVAAVAVIVPAMIDMLVRIQRFVIEHPEGLPPPSDPYDPAAAPLPPELMPDFSGTALPMAAVNLVFVLLLAAAVVRRLHDADRTGWWALLPVPFMAVGAASWESAMAMSAGAPMAADPATMLLMLNSLFYWVAAIALVVMLVQAGTPGPNRYGPPPYVST